MINFWKLAYKEVKKERDQLKEENEQLKKEKKVNRTKASLLTEIEIIKKENKELKDKIERLK